MYYGMDNNCKIIIIFTWFAYNNSMLIMQCAQTFRKLRFHDIVNINCDQSLVTLIMPSFVHFPMLMLANLNNF